MWEEDILSRNSDCAFRPDSTILCIVSLQGDTVVFKDSGEFQSPEEFFRYRLIDYLKDQNYWVVEAGGYEWIEWHLVNGKNGAVDVTIAAPVPSPDGSRFLCVKEDIEACFIYNGIQVWRLSPGGLVLEFEDVDVPWGPVDAMWQDDSTITFQKHSYDWDTYDELMRPGSLRLSAEGEWIPDDPEDWLFN
jgi:hypothetical protein